MENNSPFIRAKDLRCRAVIALQFDRAIFTFRDDAGGWGPVGAPI